MESAEHPENGQGKTAEGSEDLKGKIRFVTASKNSNNRLFAERKPHFALDRDRQRKRKLINKRIYRVFQALDEVE